MIVYRELSSVEEDLGFSAKTLYSVSNSLSKHYRTAELPKKSGGVRKLCVPDKLLMSIQKRIAQVILSQEEISPYATAYRPGGSALLNAKPHVGRQTVLKLDIRNFFDNVMYSAVKDKAFPKKRYSEPIRVLLAMLCYYDDALPQGAPTSPVISNIIMKEFDNTVGKWCARRKIAYTRYCDDMTFSGDFNVRRVKDFVARRLKKMGFFLNESKTVTARHGSRQSVTGIVVNEKPNISSAYRRAIRQEIYFCRKFGFEDHLRHRGEQLSVPEYIESLRGRINYVLSVCPKDWEFLNYRFWLTTAARKFKI